MSTGPVHHRKTPSPDDTGRAVPRGEVDEFAEQGSLVVEQRFAIVPEWVLDAGVSDVAFRLYVVLLRYGQSSGQRMPGRKLLAARLHKRSTDTVDRALKELVAVGAVVVERRRTGRTNLTNRYHVMTTQPGRQGRPGRGRKAPGDIADSGSSYSATPERGSRGDAATPGRIAAARLAAGERPDPGVQTQEEPPPPPPSTKGGTGTGPARGGAGAGARGVGMVDLDALRAVLGLDSLDEVVARCHEVRARRGLPTGRWTARVLAEMLHDAVIVKDWPAKAAVPALLAIAADPATRSPARLSCPGPWWDAAENARPRGEPDPEEFAELTALEARLVETDGRRVWAQRQARRHLAAAGEPVTRLSVARTAVRLLDETEAEQTSRSDQVRFH